MKYQLTLNMSEGLYQFTLRPNCFFSTTPEALDQQASENAEELIRMMEVWLDYQQKEIHVRIKPNQIEATDADLYDFQWYDDTIIARKDNGWFFAPEAWVKLTRESFIQKMADDYQHHEWFECDAYGIVSLTPESAEERAALLRREMQRAEAEREREKEAERTKKTINLLMEGLSF